jgi:Cu/Ag efflux protein CusF
VRTAKFALVAAALTSAFALAGLAHAQAPSGHEHHAAAAMTQPGNALMSEGEIRKIDAAARKITLKHGPLKNLDMPAMTMAFRVSDPAMLGQLKVGDKVRFVAANPGGQLTVTDIQPAQ